MAMLMLSAWQSAPSVEDLEQQAAAGNPEALYGLSTLFERGYDSIPANPARADSLLRAAAEAGHLPAQNYLGYTLISEGKGEEGLQWLERAAMAGDPKAQSNLGFLLLDDGGANDGLRSGIVADNEKAAFWLQRAAAAGAATASSMLGDLYRDGRGVAQDSLQAAACYYAAIDMGLADAAYKLVALEADRWDAESPERQLNHALYLYTHRAPDLAIPIFQRLSEGESLLTSAAAYALLGDAYTRALGAGYDHEQSLLNYWRAAELGNAPAQFVIAELLEIFPDALDRLTSDPPTAQQLREAAAAAGITSAEEATTRLMNPLPTE